MMEVSFNRCPQCGRSMVRYVGVEPYWSCDCGYFENVDEPLEPVGGKE